jgi:hypothetical protein
MRSRRSARRCGGAGRTPSNSVAAYGAVEGTAVTSLTAIGVRQSWVQGDAAGSGSPRPLWSARRGAKISAIRRSCGRLSYPPSRHGRGFPRREAVCAGARPSPENRRRARSGATAAAGRCRPPAPLRSAVGRLENSHRRCGRTRAVCRARPPGFAEHDGRPGPMLLTRRACRYAARAGQLRRLRCRCCQIR